MPPPTPQRDPSPALHLFLLAPFLLAGPALTSHGCSLHLQGVLIECDPAVKSIIVNIDSENHDYIIEDLDEQRCVIKETMVAQLKQKLDEVRPTVPPSPFSQQKEEERKRSRKKKSRRARNPCAKTTLLFPLMFQAYRLVSLHANIELFRGRLTLTRPSFLFCFYRNFGIRRTSRMGPGPIKAPDARKSMCMHCRLPNEDIGSSHKSSRPPPPHSRYYPMFGGSASTRPPPPSLGWN